MSHLEASLVDHDRLRGSWAERATERLRVSGERTASLRTSINSAREHLATYQATDSPYGIGCVPSGACSHSPESLQSMEPAEFQYQPRYEYVQQPSMAFSWSHATSPAPTESVLGSPSQPGNTKGERLAPCSPTTEQLISQSARLHRTMQEQAAQLRVQQDKLTTLSQRVLAHKGDSPSRPPSSSHVSPAPPPEREHAQPALPSSSQQHERDVLRSSAASLPSSSVFTVRSSSRGVRDSRATASESLRASHVGQTTEHAHDMQHPVDAAAYSMAALRFAENHNTKTRQRHPQNHLSVPSSQPGASQYASGSMGASGGFYVRNMSSSHASLPGAAHPASVASPYVMHTDHAHMLGNPASGAQPSGDFTCSQKLSAANLHAAPQAQPMHSNDVQASGHPGASSYQGYSSAPKQPVNSHYTHTTHRTGPASYTTDAAKGSESNHYNGASGTSPVAPWPQSLQPAEPVWQPGARTTAAAPPLLSKASDVQSAVSELLQTLSETRQRHAAAVQTINGAYHSNYGASRSIPDPVQPPTGFAAAQASATQHPTLARESSGLRAVQHPVVQSVINQLVSSIATHATGHPQTSPMKETSDVTRPNDGMPARQPAQSETRAAKPRATSESAFPDGANVPVSRHGDYPDWKPTEKAPGTRFAPEKNPNVQAKHRVQERGQQEEREILGSRKRADERAKLDEHISKRMAPSRRNFLSVRDLKRAEGDTFTDEYDTDAPSEHMHGNHAWDSAAGHPTRSQGCRSVPATEGPEHGGFRPGREGTGTQKRGDGAAQRKKSGWDSTVGVPWSEAEAKGKGGRRIPPIGGYGSGYGDDRAAHTNANPHSSGNTDPLKLFKASTKGVGVPMRGQGRMHDGHASTLGKRSRERRGGGITDVPAKARTARTALGNVHGKPATNNRAPKPATAEFTVRRTGGGGAPPRRGSLRKGKGKGGWSWKPQTSEGDFAGDPILEGESTVLSAGEEDGTCAASDRDSDFGDEHNDEHGYHSYDDVHQTNTADERSRSPYDRGEPSQQTIWEEHEAVRAAAHSLHAHGSAPTVDDAVGILEAQLREAVQAAQADSCKKSDHDGRAHASGTSQDHESSSPCDTTTTQSSSHSGKSRSCNCADTPNDSKSGHYHTQRQARNTQAHAPSEPPPPAWRRLEELEARVDSLVSRMRAPHASHRAHASRRRRSPSRGRRNASTAPNASPTRVHRNQQHILHHHVRSPARNTRTTGMHERSHPRTSKPPGSRSVPPCKNLPQGSGITAENLAEKLADIELAESTIFNRWFTADGQPRSSPLPLPLGTSSNSKDNIQSDHVAPVDTSYEVHSVAAHMSTSSAHDTKKASDQKANISTSGRMHMSTSSYKGQENSDAGNSPPVQSAAPSYEQRVTQGSLQDKARNDAHESRSVHWEQFRNSPAVPVTDHAFKEPRRSGDAMHAVSHSAHVPEVEATETEEQQYEDHGLGRVDTLASAYTACTNNAADAWAGAGGETSRNILKRTGLCMHGPRDVCAHCIANTPRPPSYTPRDPRLSESIHRGGHRDDASDGGREIRAYHMHEMHAAPAAAPRQSATTEWFTRSEVDDIIASRDECVARRAQQEVEYLLKGGCDMETIKAHSERLRGSERRSQQCMPGMQRSAFVNAVELMADSVIDAVVDEQVDAMLGAVDSAAARLVVEECADQYPEKPPKRASPNRNVEFVDAASLGL